MPGKKKQSPLEILTEVILDAMTEKKAKDQVILNFTQMNGSVCDEFIICHGTSRTQVEAIADSVVAEVKKKTGINPWHKEGTENAEWILIDFVDIVVHIFQENRRKFYNLEQLWADAAMKRIKAKE